MFYWGEAELLNAKGQHTGVTLGYFISCSDLVAAKYSNAERESNGSKWPTYICRWNNLTTPAKPPGMVKIVILGGRVNQGNGPENTVIISCSIGSDWVRAKTCHKDI